MATDYLLPLLNSSAQTATYNNTTSSVAGTIALSAAGNVVSPTLSGNTAVNVLSVTFTLAPNSGRTGVSATDIGVYLTQGSIYGNTIVYGKVTDSTLNGGTSSITATIKFNDPNYVTTTIYLSTNRNQAIALTTGTAISQLDNPFVVLNTDGRYTAVFDGLTSRNVVYRTVGRQSRLRQGYEA